VAAHVSRGNGLTHTPPLLPWLFWVLDRRSPAQTRSGDAHTDTATSQRCTITIPIITIAVVVVVVVITVRCCDHTELRQDARGWCATGARSWLGPSLCM